MVLWYIHVQRLIWICLLWIRLQIDSEHTRQQHLNFVMWNFFFAKLMNPAWSGNFFFCTLHPKRCEQKSFFFACTFTIELNGWMNLSLSLCVCVCLFDLNIKARQNNGIPGTNTHTHTSSKRRKENIDNRFSTLNSRRWRNV